MNIKFTAVVTAFLLASGSAQNGTVKPPAQPEVSSPVAGATSGGSSSTGMAQTSAGAPMTVRTRDDVYAEAVRTVKNYKSTRQEDLEFFQKH